MSKFHIEERIWRGTNRKVEVDEEEIDNLVDDVIDIVLQNSYVESEKTSDGSGREYYDYQLFPEKGCEEKVKKLIQKMAIKTKDE